MNDLYDGNEEEAVQYTTETSSLEELMIQALINQLTDIVNCQNRSNRISYEKALIQAQTFRSLVESALMLTEGESVCLHGGKIQTFLNKAILNHTFSNKTAPGNNE